MIRVAAQTEMTDDDVFAFMRAVQAVKVDEGETEKEAREAQRALDAQVAGSGIKKARGRDGRKAKTGS